MLPSKESVLNFKVSLHLRYAYDQLSSWRRSGESNPSYALDVAFSHRRYNKRLCVKRTVGRWAKTIENWELPAQRCEHFGGVKLTDPHVSRGGGSGGGG